MTIPLVLVVAAAALVKGRVVNDDTRGAQIPKALRIQPLNCKGWFYRRKSDAHQQQAIEKREKKIKEKKSTVQSCMEKNSEQESSKIERPHVSCSDLPKFASNICMLQGLRGIATLKATSA